MKIEDINKTTDKESSNNRKRNPLWWFTVVLILCFGTGFLIFLQSNTTSQPLEVQANWERTRYIHQIEIDYIIRDDYVVELEALESKREFFNYITDNYDAFIMDSQHIWFADNGFDLYIDPATAPPLELSPIGYRIDVCLNFLELNPISTVNTIPIKEQINWNSSVLNILVPEHLKPYEKYIKLLYLEDFYFRQVIVDNHYNEELGLPLNTTSINELSINIIYVESEQYYFSFDPTLRPETGGRILDPIAVVYTGNIHNSFLGSWFSQGSVYFQSQTDIQNAIFYTLAKHELDDISRINSVYEQSNQIIQ